MRHLSESRFFKRLLDEVSQVRGADAISMSSEAWFGLLNFQLNIESEPLPDGDATVRYSSIAPDYFKVLGAQIRRGRDFDDHDEAKSRGVAIINEALARRYFPDSDPIGKKIVLGYMGRRLPREIVGVSSDIKQEELGSPAKPEMYVPYQQVPWLGAALIVRTSIRDPLSLQKDLQQAIWKVDPELPVTRADTVGHHLADLVAEPRLYTLLLGVFAAVALVLASVGIYGVMSYSVTERTREIGIRMALGAAPSEVLGLVIRQGLMLATAGVAIGLAVAFALTRVLTSLLYGVSATDLATFAGVSVILTGVALAASFVPARRATKVDPMIALRYE